MNRILNQQIDLDAFLFNMGICEVSNNLYCNEDGDHYLALEGETIGITDHSDIPVVYREAKMPITVQDGLELIKVYLNEEVPQDESQVILEGYQSELNRREYLKRLNTLKAIL